MKKTILALLLIPALAFTSRYADPLEIGAALPKVDRKMKDVSGKELSFADVKTKKGLLVMFSCNTCPWVIRNQERTRQICAYAMEKGLGVILLNSNEGSRSDGDSFEAMQDYAKEQGYKWSYVVDKNHEMADAFGADRTPECFLFDGNDKLVYHGAIDDNPQSADGVKRSHLKEAINEILQGKQVSVKKSRSVGCNIKRI
jgi:thioredoxin-related protein